MLAVEQQPQPQLQQHTVPGHGVAASQGSFPTRVHAIPDAVVVEWPSDPTLADRHCRKMAVVHFQWGRCVIPLRVWMVPVLHDAESYISCIGAVDLWTEMDALPISIPVKHKRHGPVTLAKLRYLVANCITNNEIVRMALFSIALRLQLPKWHRLGLIDTARICSKMWVEMNDNDLAAVWVHSDRIGTITPWNDAKKRGLVVRVTDP
jgi:hypothetical protein